MKFVFLHVSTAHEKWADAVVNLYTEKISHFTPFEVQALKPKKYSRDNHLAKRDDDTKLILAFLKPDDFVVLLDEKGKPLDSFGWAKSIETMLQSGKKRSVWIIGGAYGVSEELKKRANLQLTLGPFVMNHLVAQAVAIEQIYRGFTIIKGLPYHNS